MDAFRSETRSLHPRCARWQRIGGRSALTGTGRTPRPRGGFTLVETMVALGIVLVLVGLTLAVVMRARQSAQSVQCMTNLRSIGQAFLSYATSHGGAFPDPLAAGLRWEEVIAPLLSADDVFRCTADEELFPAFSSSYDWRDTGDPLTTLAGRRLTGVKRGDAVLAFESLPGWHAKRRMNAVRVDGSVQVYEQHVCLQDLTRHLDGVGVGTAGPSAASSEIRP